MSLNEHREILERLWRENMSDPKIAKVIPARIEWLYEQNPEGPARTWLGQAPAPESTIIGCGSLYPRWMDFRGRTYRVGNLVDFAVDKLHRIAGSAVAIQSAIARESLDFGFDLVYVWPNSRSLAVFKRVGYTVLGKTSRWVKPIRVEKKLGEVLKNPIITKVVAKGIDGFLLSNDWRKIILKMSTGSLRTEIVRRADFRFDALWNRVPSPHFIGVKNALYLNWRYADCPTEAYYFYCLVDNLSQDLLGYAVFSLKDDIAMIEDLFVDGLAEHLAILLLGLSGEVRKQGARSISLTYIGSDVLLPRLRSLGFYNRGGDRFLMVKLGKNAHEELRNGAFDANNWFAFSGDLDI
jgi:hypothetical protein